MIEHVTEDFERRRRDRETANERIVCLVGAATAAVVVVTGYGAEAAVAAGLIAAPTGWIVPLPVRAAAAGIVVAHLVLLALLARSTRYNPLRKYLLVVLRVALLGLMCWGQWHNSRPDFGLLAPLSGFTMLIVLTGLSFSRRAVVLAGVLSCLTYSAVVLLGPHWPESLHAAVVGVQACAVAAVVTAYIVDGMLGMHRESVSNERLSRFFAPEVAARIADEPEVTVRAVESHVTVLFSDISGFTEMSSGMHPQQVVDLLNGYFPSMVEIVFRHGGMLEKFIGDALLAIWGAPFGHPDDADRAVAAALEMQRSLGPVNERLTAAGLPPIAVHIGLCSGPVAAGYIGTQKYIQYAVIGDTTNVASRVCGVAGAGEILVTDSTRALLRRTDLRLEPLPPVAVKGKAEPLHLHRVHVRENTTP